jgi:enoyl-CoA hydratase/carnithine racemase
MGGRVQLQPADGAGIARVLISHPGKLNALSVAMWHELRAVFDALNTAEAPPRAVLLYGDGGHFVAGGDIEEFPSFRFDEQRLRLFHEEAVAPALRAMLDCDIPIVAQIDGPCVGGGLEIAACCDLRICGRSSRFGIPIARLGFPLAPSEAQIVARAIGLTLLRELLVEARLLGADEALARGLVSRVVDDGAVATEAQAACERIAALSPQAQRLNKRTLRQLAEGGPSAAQRHEHFGYADSPEHREGLAAFVQKRPARF